MALIVAWVLVAFVIVNSTLAIRRVLRSGQRTGSLVVDVAITVLMALYIGNLATIPWNESLPVPLWWFMAALVGVYAGMVAHQVLPRRE